MESRYAVISFESQDGDTITVYMYDGRERILEKDMHYIVEACNNHEALKEENTILKERLKKALSAGGE